MSNYLGKLNKVQLAEFARPLGISPQLKKSDLIEKIEQAANSQRASLESDPIFQEYFETLSADSSALIRAQTPKSTTRRRSRYSKAPEDEDTDQSSEPPVDIITPAKKAVRAGVRSTRKSVAAAATALQNSVAAPLSPASPVHEAPAIDPEPVHPLSPSQLASSIPVKNFSLNAIGEAVSSWFTAAAQTTGFWEHVDYTRETLSDPKAIHAIIATYELAWLCHDLIPWQAVAIPVPPVDVTYTGYSTGPATVKIPDLFILLSWHYFWAPVVYWFTLGVSFPLLSSYFVNISNKSTYDPLTFSISKALIAYLVYSKQIIRPEVPRLFTPDTASLVGSIVGEETPLIGAAIGGLLTLWDAIITRR
ncbi:hypothetical protein ABW20_dc0110149 [Dactylellina cionopaga]|nr:hypothetical protein ABW20_dc0110149 [Dactylellina cionopaga]